MQLTIDSKFADIQQWLDKKLTQQQSIKACCEEVTKVQNQKGFISGSYNKEADHTRIRCKIKMKLLNILYSIYSKMAYLRSIGL